MKNNSKEWKNSSLWFTAYKQWQWISYLDVSFINKSKNLIVRNETVCLNCKSTRPIFAWKENVIIHKYKPYNKD